MLCKRRSIRRCLALMIALVLPLCAACAQEQTLPSAGTRDQTVRVYLSRLNLSGRMDLTLISPYSVTTQQGARLHFQAGSEVAVLLRDSALYLYYEGMSQLAGQNVTLLRDEAEGESGFRLTNYPALYAGDLQIDVVDGKVRPVLSVHVEDYLLGVVPYEMSDSFPLEALKAQAVAARTYALRSQDATQPYDLVDTTNDQVYRGYLPGNDKTEQAIRETRGVCGFYRDQLAQCYYSASNGGQTELVETVWPTDEDFGYYAFGDDPYDVANPDSVVRSFEMKKTYGEEETAPYALRSLLATQLFDQLTALGYDPAPESVRVDGVSAVSVSGAASEDNKYMTRLTLTVSISGRTRKNAPAPVVDLNAEEVSLFEVVEETPSPTPTAVQTTGFVPVVTVTPSPTPTPVYGPFTPIEEPFTLEMDIFPTAEKALGLDITAHYDNELWSVRETEDAFIIEARRYGHGVGMSQRGAQWMAAEHGKTYQEIIAFYYPGLTLMRYEEQPAQMTQPEMALAATPGPAPSPTPRPTLMPMTLTPQEGQWLATVTEIDDDSSLNLRSTPDLGGEILMRLYKGQQLLVLERCPQEGWVKVRTDVAEGYVVEEYLTAETP
ncbi:MAG TPA: SpoIID/LytB domain-containing protein [Candidatus Limiplasma pullicola]|nr:SpoIID/LytB domain-containing protein [Candidatus Limiplasma pullicola]